MTISGNWGQPPAQLSDKSLLPDKVSSVTVEVDGLTGYGTFLAAFLYRLHRECEARGLPPPNTDKLPEGVREMLKLAVATPVQSLPQENPLTWRGRSIAFLRECSKAFLKSYWRAFIAWMAFIGSVVIALKRLFTRKARMQWSDVYGEIYKAGPQALGIVMLIGFLMGLILAFIGSIPLKWFGAESYISSLIGIGMLRLMG
ncbi:MAG: ABC transporter permease, partial [Victivallales bacterium]|nr:ABC transporter permease [Victivallales bacterium]